MEEEVAVTFNLAAVLWIEVNGMGIECEG